MNFKFFITIFIVLSLQACADSDNPYSIFKNPLEDGQTSTSGAWPVWHIYTDEKQTSGGIMFFTTTEGQALNFKARDSYSGNSCVAYSWDGSEVYSYGDSIRESDWVGWSFIVGNSEADYDTKTVNMSSSGYTKISFYARGSATARLEGDAGLSSSVSPNDTTGDIILTSSWQKYSFNITPGSAVKDYFKVILKSPGVLYLDDIKYE